ncbi:flagellar biosynthetic protein FliR [Metapseudomonas resinovorans]|uniref:Flagellar biosynthetic protein FliR n=1 Tax=Metapseudomonas resinovorans NBRC 106553 TaxID=1245471 RepID=S6AHF6_METRE|nr:flagellar biosynthetic protein FliR [Pseudomonas resinovorans]BAN49952.1 flagellar biosynthesis protein FliR [Pseudomonas resinovorans NBRC 106553]
MAGNDAILQLSQYLHQLQSYWWPFCRIMAVFGIAPLFSHKALPARLRVLLALALTLALAAALPPMPAIEPLSARGLLTALEQVAFGLLLGLALMLVFAIFGMVGDVIATQLGLSMALFNDPVNGVSSSSIIFQLYFILLVFLFFAIDGHLLVVSILFQSFIYWPVGSGLHYSGLQAVLQSLGWVFSAAVLVSLPLVFCMSLLQFCFGLLNRISPAMNLFSLGFPMAIIAGLMCIQLTLPNLPESYLHLTRELLDNLGRILVEGRNG